MSWTAGDEVTYNIDFLVDNEFVIPESATATVRDNGGVAIPDLTDLPLAVDTTSATITIPAEHNSVGDGRNLENRFISVAFVYEGKTYRQTHYYKLFPFLPITAVADDVRRELGLSVMELPDEDIHIPEAYTLLKLDYGDRFEEAFTAGNERTIAANQAVAVKAAIDVIGSLQLRVGTKHVAEDHQFERRDDFDVAQIQVDLGRKLARAIDVAIEETDSSSSRTVFTLTSPTDAITGE